MSNRIISLKIKYSNLFFQYVYTTHIIDYTVNITMLVYGLRLLLCGVVALRSEVDNKVPQLHATQSEPLDYNYNSMSLSETQQTLNQTKEKTFYNFKLNKIESI